MPDSLRVVGGPCDGHYVRGHHPEIRLPLDENLKPPMGPEQILYLAIYRLNDSGEEPVYEYVDTVVNPKDLPRSE